MSDGEEELADAPQSDDSTESSSEDEAVPIMVLARARRANAGNRMSNLIALAEADDQERVIYGDASWEETVDDIEFGGVEAEAPDDVSLESSSDEDEDGGDDDEEAGEKEIKKQERAEKTKKRKDMANPFANAARKKVRLNPVANVIHPPRPKKKSERDSWLPTGEEGPTRSSDRRQTVKNKADTHARLLQKEKTREKVVKLMEAANRRKEEFKPLSQAEKLAMAAKIEKENSKSLNRWEEAETRRAAEQQERLDAQRNRQLDGPFIRVWSGPAVWKDERLISTGAKTKIMKAFKAGTLQDTKKNDEISQAMSDHAPTEQPNAAVPLATSAPDHVRTEQPNTAVPLATSAPDHAPTEQPNPAVPLATSAPDHVRTEQPNTAVPLATSAPEPVPAETPTMTPQIPAETVPASPQGNQLVQVVSEQAESVTALSREPNNMGTLPQQPQAPQAISQPTAPLAPQPTVATSTAISSPSMTTTGPPPTDSSFLDGILDWASVHKPPEPMPIPTSTYATPPQNTHPTPPTASNTSIPPSIPTTNAPLIDPPPPPPKPAPTFHLGMRNLLSLSTTDLPPATKSLIWPVLLAPPSKRRYLTMRRDNANYVVPPRCVITGQIARYRDPSTGLPYSSAYAYKCIKRLVGGSCVWSQALGCWVGARYGDGGGRPARGVPERFWKEGPKVEKVDGRATGEGGVAEAVQVEAGATETTVKDEDVVMTG